MHMAYPRPSNEALLPKLCYIYWHTSSNKTASGIVLFISPHCRSWTSYFGPQSAYKALLGRLKGRIFQYHFIDSHDHAHRRNRGECLCSLSSIHLWLATAIPSPVLSPDRNPSGSGSLTVDAYPLLFAAFLSAAPRPQLTTVRLCTPRLADQALFLAFCTYVAGSCPAVEYVCLNLYSDEEEPPQALSSTATFVHCFDAPT